MRTTDRFSCKLRSHFLGFPVPQPIHRSTGCSSHRIRAGSDHKAEHKGEFPFCAPSMVHQTPRSDLWWQFKGGLQSLSTLRTDIHTVHSQRGTQALATGPQRKLQTEHLATQDHIHADT